MKTNELRIGNYIYLELGLPSLNLHTIQPEDIVSIDLSEKNCQPIPLTDQWLKDFNIKKRTVVGETKERMFIDNIEIPEWIKYVHDLQNWYYYKFEKTELTKQ